MKPPLFHILVYLIIGNMIWQKILKKSAYPDSVPTQLKWFHGIILFVIDASAWIACIGLFFWLFSYFRFGSSTTMTPLIMVAALIEGLAAICLMKICSQMVNRKNVLKWYFIIFPIYFTSAALLQIEQSRMTIPMQTIIISIACETIMFLLAIIFYLRSSTRKAIFDLKYEGANNET
jgi:hypothetical protein